MISTEKSIQLTCYHCGEDCLDEALQYDEKNFCCKGCKTVYEIISQGDLCNYYTLNNNPGKQLKNSENKNYQFLEDISVASKFITYSDDKQTHVSFIIPAVHCSSCIWLLENLHQLHPQIISARVNFIKKEIAIVFNNSITIVEIAQLLDKLGYAPRMSLGDLSEQNKKKSYFENKYFFKLGIAFFCFGNIMLLSFPEYFGIESWGEFKYHNLFNYLNILLSLPVLFYCSSEFFVNAINGLKLKTLNMDFPIALGIVMMFLRSLYEILSETGTGYLDTLAGLVFLMLVGRALQNLSFAKLSFDHDYKSYFPLSVSLLKNGEEINTVANQIKINDRLLIRNQEIIPADAILVKGEAHIDYSFVTGESVPIPKAQGSLIYAGGRQVGAAITVEVIKEISQSYLTRLWNDENQTKIKEEKDKVSTLNNKISNYFSIIILLIAIGSGLYWMNTDFSKAIHAFTSVLIITCPCALALSAPFTLSNTLTRFGTSKFYLKKPIIIEKMAAVDTIVFDKTGTLTQTNNNSISYYGKVLNEFELSLVKSVCKNSNHPLSRSIANKINANTVSIENFQEINNKGITGTYLSTTAKIGSYKWILPDAPLPEAKLNTITAISINGEYKGYFELKQSYREQLIPVIEQLKHHYKLEVLSGDNDSESENLKRIFGADTKLFFNQSPFDKQNHIAELQNQNKKVLMIGDGLNDAGALLKSDVGIAVSEDINNFSPACDAILDAKSFKHLPEFLKISKLNYSIIIISFIISFIYNIIGLFYATQGNLSPLFAAILMPISSISIILFTTLSTHLVFKRIFKK